MKIPRAIKRRIREMIAAEMRDRLTEVPGTLDHLPSDDPLIMYWSDYVLEIAQQISPEWLEKKVPGASLPEAPPPNTVAGK